MAGTAWLDDALQDIRDRHQWRSLDRRVITSRDARTVVVDGKELICFASNDYLGLGADEWASDASRRATSEWGTGSGASRHISGNLALHRELEEQLAAFCRAEQAALFGSGFLANVGCIRSLVGPGDHVFSDELNHASLIDGCRQSRAHVHVYQHGNTSHLQQLLEKHVGGRRLIVTDSLFSMDGDLAPLRDICSLADTHDVMTLVDEAHALGTVGRGAGWAVECGLEDRITIRVVTMGKALGSYGAAALGNDDVINLIVNTARALIFSTALPPGACGATRAALEIIKTGIRQQRLETLEGLCMREFRSRGLTRFLPDHLAKLDAFPTPIVPVIIGDNERSLQVARQLEEEGILVVGIRPPTVAEGTARLRITLSSAHTDSDIGRLADALQRALVGQQALEARA
jgi:8-amino-7-oxononanoate synthase